jgi:hypothetical protein
LAWWWRKHVHPKHRLTLDRLPCVISHKIEHVGLSWIYKHSYLTIGPVGPS